MASTADPTVADYSRLGWAMFPCHSIVNGACSCGNDDCDSPGKHPRTYNGVKAATNDLHQLREWARQFPNCNWGLATGQPSNVIVIDIDQRKDGFHSFDEYENLRRGSGDFGQTLIAQTGSGGRHIFLQAPDIKVRNRVNWLPGVDVRADGGYVILPPGSHISGGVYSWTNWGYQIMSAPDDFVRSANEGGGFGGDSSVIKELSVDDFIEGIAEGSRDDTIFRMACKLRRQLSDNRAAVTVLCLQAAANSQPPFPEKEALKKIDQAFKQDHSDLEAMIFQGTDTEEPLSHLTDMGNRDRFISSYGDDYRFVVGVGWHKWGDDGWHKVDELTPHRDAQVVPEMIRAEANTIGDSTVKQKFTKWARDTESSGRIAAILTMAKGHESIKKTVDDFDSNPYMLACANGMVDLSTGHIRPFTRDDLFTRNTRVVYERDYKHSKWEAFMDSVTDGDDELKEYLQMAAGYTLTGSIAEECFFIVSGLRQTGKSTFMSAIETSLGTYASVSSAEVFMKRYGKEAPREELVKFAGSRLVTTEELPEGERFDDALLKRITGGSRLSARYLYQESFEYIPQFKLWVATNFDPITSDSAMFRRIKRIPFNVTIPEARRDRTLKDMLRDRSAGGKAVLAWAVEGAIKYIEAGKLETPTQVVLATSSYEQEQDSFSHFMNEVFDHRPGQRVAETAAYQLHAEWAKRNAERQMKRPQFVQKMRERGFIMRVDDDTQTRFIENLAVRLTGVMPFQQR